MRILVLCYEYPPIGGGGGRVSMGLAEALAARGHEVRVQTAALGWRSSRERLGGVDVYRTASGRRSPEHCRVHEMALFVATSFWPTLRHCRAWRPEVIHAHFAMPSGLLAWAAHEATRIPYVLTAHLGDVPGGVPEQTDTLFRFAAPLARAVWKGAAGRTAVSDFVGELAERAYGGKVARILNGIDLAGRPARPERLNAHHLVFLGRVNPQKNAPLLVEALARIADLPWRFTLIGDGPDLPRVREGLARHALAERSALLGWRSASEVEAILREADVLCLPSSSEGMPVAAIEALKCGVAIAGTSIPGLRDVLVSGVNGLSAPAGEAEAFAAALREMLTDETRLLQMRQASWEKAAAFSLPRIVDEYEAVLAAAAKSPVGVR